MSRGEPSVEAERGATLRLGTGAGFSGDRLKPAIDLVNRGNLDFLILECLAERTIALAHKARLRDGAEGFDPLLDFRLRALLPICAKHGTRIISNMGAANPAAAARQARLIAKELGLQNLTVAAVTGDDLLEEVKAGKMALSAKEPFFPEDKDRIISANAYLGAFPLVEALEQGADVILTGRVADPALFLAPLIHHFGWRNDDWHLLGCGTALGHLMECAGQVTGGYFSDPGKKDVPDIANLGFPIAEANADGSFVITKLPDTGGLISRATCTEQLLYEVHDPAAYIQPDVVADFSGVTFDQIGHDRILVSGATGHPRTPTLKVSVGYLAGWKGEGQISYFGVGSAARAREAGEILMTWLSQDFPEVPEFRLTYIGADTEIAPAAADVSGCGHVRLRFVTRMPDQASADWTGRAVESLYLNGPAGGGGVTRLVEETIAIASGLVARTQVHADVLIVPEDK